MFTFGETLHHAYAIEGAPSTARLSLLTFLASKYHFTSTGNPDFRDEINDVFTVDEARALKAWVEQRGMTDGKRVAIIEAITLTSEAQNALLKIFEEPTPNVHFFIIGQVTKHLLPTLSSRIFKIQADGQTADIRETEAAEFATDFLSSPVAGRMSMTKDLADDISAEVRPKSDAVRRSLIITARTYAHFKNKRELPLALFSELLTLQNYFTDPSASVKMLLEEMALIIPQIK